MYSFNAKNAWGDLETKAQFTVTLKPEFEGLKEAACIPGDSCEFSCYCRACPRPKVTWSKNGVLVQNTEFIEITEDYEKEFHRVVFKKVSMADIGDYELKGVNSEGETVVIAKLNGIMEMPKFITGIADQTVHDDGELNLRIRTDAIPKPEIRWLIDGKQFKEDDRHKIVTQTEGQIVSELTVTHFTEQDAGVYSCISGNCVGEVETVGNITLSQEVPTFDRKLDRAMEIAEDDFLELKAKVNGSPLPTCQWFKNGVPVDPNDPRIKTSIDDDGNCKLRIENCRPEDSGAYKLVITNKNGVADSQCAVVVDRKPFKPKFNKGLQDTKVIVGEPLCLEAWVSSFPPPEIKWFKDGLPIRPQKGISFENHPNGHIVLTIDYVDPDHPGVYTLVASNKLGESTTAAQIFLEERPRKPEFIIQLKSVTAVEGFPVLLEVRATGCPSPEVHWYV